MTFGRVTLDERRDWSLAVAVALVAHIGLFALSFLWSRPAVLPVPEPVVLIELPPEAGPAPSIATPFSPVEPQVDAAQPQVVTTPVDVPPVRAPLPQDAVALPQARPTVATPLQTAAPSPAVSAPSKPVAAAPTGTGSGTSTTPGNDPRAKKAEADYFSMISAHLNRRKTYPTDAKKARQEGVVTVRFTVDRSGGVSGVSIRRSSGHDLLDSATLQLLQRVAPLPKMPATMQRDSVTVSLPIDYSLRTS